MSLQIPIDITMWLAELSLENLLELDSHLQVLKEERFEQLRGRLENIDREEEEPSFEENYQSEEIGLDSTNEDQNDSEEVEPHLEKVERKSWADLSEENFQEEPKNFVWKNEISNKNVPNFSDILKEEEEEKIAREQKEISTQKEDETFEDEDEVDPVQAQSEENKQNYLDNSEDLDRTAVVVYDLFPGMNYDQAREKIISVLNEHAKIKRVKSLRLVCYDNSFSGTVFFWCFDQKQAAKVFQFFGKSGTRKVQWRKITN